MPPYCRALTLLSRVKYQKKTFFLTRETFSYLFFWWVGGAFEQGRKNIKQQVVKIIIDDKRDLPILNEIAIIFN